MTSADASTWAIPAQDAGTTQTLLTAEQGGLVKRTVLPGGLRVITEQMPGVRSVAFGIWVGVGSRDETHAQMGSAHYLEHLLFKGTKKREALEISSSIESVGGEMNAFTSKEYTCYYARVVDQDLPLAIDVISDLVTSALLRPEDVEGERGVILEEIAMRDDDPSDLVHDEFMEALFGDTDLGRSILGTQGTIEDISPEAIASFYGERYKPPAMVVAVAGALEHEKVVELVEAAFRRAEVLVDGQAPLPHRVGESVEAAKPNARIITRPTEQAHIVLGGPAVLRTDPRRHALSLVTNALGGGMSSRLFQEVRERRGLAYTVYAFQSGFADAGLFGVYAGCLPSKVDQVLEIVRAELDKVALGGITEDEIERGKGQARGSMALGMEDSGSRMTRIAKADLVMGELPSIDETLRRIDAVTLDEVATVSAEVLSAARTLTVISPLESSPQFHAG